MYPSFHVAPNMARMVYILTTQQVMQVTFVSDETDDPVGPFILQTFPQFISNTTNYNAFECLKKSNGFCDENSAMPSAIGGGHASHSNISIPSNEECGIRDVWKHNLEEEFRTIRQVVQNYNHVGMDTEFPGVVARPIGDFRSPGDYQYQLLRCNVDLLHIIQLGLTFMDEEGKTPPGYSTWQFNFKFNLSEDMYAQDSIDLLQNSGIQFKKHEEDGIDPFEFAELLMTSGVVLMDNIKWLSFHSGYDFGYMLKLLTYQNLPADESEFFELLRLYFPTIYDVKYLMKSCKNLKGGLQEVADQLELRRVGPQHQAGSDSHLTGMAFFKMREVLDKTEYNIALQECSRFLSTALF